MQHQDISLSYHHWLAVCVGTVENHGNREITDTVIFVKCCEFCQNAVFFCQNAIVLHFYKNILFLISIS